MSTQNSPTEQVRIGTVKAAIWRNHVGDDGNVRYGVTFGKLYRNDDGKWQTGRSFGLNDLLVLAKLADQVHTRIHELRAESPEEDA
ncbi:MAG: hypothetical protein OXG74_13705 [Acidobacteria bacterium]|nr:hypothetical protein [Acidobacteriota bacterium]